ncbi:hypothetical protein [Treponema sp.]|uniref:hypothetical protein n=1 Tax=Treponema sp. TaxID=166 RepID=UPI003F101F57
MKSENSKYKFKLKNAKKPGMKKIKKTLGRPLTSFNVLYAYAMFTFHWTGLKYFAILIANVIQKFFIVQYLEKFHIIHIPIKNVDHEIDSKIPFKQEFAQCYLDFVNYWIRPMCLTMKRYGSFEGIKISSEYVRYMIMLYKEAYKIYSHCLTTTVRPVPTTKAAKGIQFWDPHYLCVPSLHISIVIITIAFYKMLFDREEFLQEEKDQWNRELYVHGIEIAESVLYMKQHSVNCISAAIYMVTKTAPELLTQEQATAFIDDMFKNSEYVEKNDAMRITSCIKEMYQNLMEQSQNEQDWTVPLKEWLENYKPAASI